jgi:hypothetical protein
MSVKMNSSSIQKTAFTKSMSNALQKELGNIPVVIRKAQTASLQQ